MVIFVQYFYPRPLSPSPTRREITGLMGCGWTNKKLRAIELSIASEQESKESFWVPSIMNGGGKEPRMGFPTSNLESSVFLKNEP